MFGRNGDVVEVTVTADLVEHCVVAGWPQNSKSVFDLALENGIRELNSASRREHGKAVDIWVEVATVPSETILLLASYILSLTEHCERKVQGLVKL